MNVAVSGNSQSRTVADCDFSAAAMCSTDKVYALMPGGSRQLDIQLSVLGLSVAWKADIRMSAFASGVRVLVLLTADCITA